MLWLSFNSKKPIYFPDGFQCFQMVHSDPRYIPLGESETNTMGGYNRLIKNTSYFEWNKIFTTIEVIAAARALALQR